MLNTQKLLVAITVLGFSSPVMGQDLNSAAPAVSKKVQAERDRILNELLDGTALIGSFTTDNQPTPNAAEPERYEITRLTKMTDRLYAITARIKYGKLDTRVPIAVPISWAGNTPVITMDNFKIPAVGTFSARVLFHGKRYVGTWQHGDVGGHMFGRLEKLKTKKPTTAKAADKK